MDGQEKKRKKRKKDQNSDATRPPVMKTAWASDLRLQKSRMKLKAGDWILSQATN